jgi:hypothetical protein
MSLTLLCVCVCLSLSIYIYVFRVFNLQFYLQNYDDIWYRGTAMNFSVDFHSGAYWYTRVPILR